MLYMQMIYLIIKAIIEINTVMYFQVVYVANRLLACQLCVDAVDAIKV